MNEQEIFLAAIKISDPLLRNEFISQHCGSNTNLKARIEEQLRKQTNNSQLNTPDKTSQSSSSEKTILFSGDEESNSLESEQSSAENEIHKYLQPARRKGWLGRLAHYEIDEIIGRGAFGIVAKAFDEKLHRVVAIKLMSPELVTTSSSRKRFLREARTAAAVTHENIVTIYAVEEEPIPYLVMEYIPGKNLEERLKEHGPLKIPEFLLIGQQIASGLAAAHSANLIHRDIKPSNILITENPNLRAKISDFGLARAVDDSSMTQSGFIAGTPMFMAPEQARGETLDHRADLFSLGSVLYQVVSGRSPFRASNTVAVLKRVCDDNPQPIPDIIPGTPLWLCDIISRLMEKDREKRFQSAHEVADLLKHYQHGNWDEQAISSHTSTVILKPLSGKNLKGTERTSKKGVLWGLVLTAAVVFGLAVLNAGKKQAHTQITDSSDKNSTSTTTDHHKAQPATSTLVTGWHGWPNDAPKHAIAPFDAAQAKKYQEEWAAYLKVPVEYTNSIGMKFRLIPPGEFLRGCAPDEIDDLISITKDDPGWQSMIRNNGPQHQVVLTRPFYLGMTELTQSQYKLITGKNSSVFSTTDAGEVNSKTAGLNTENFPVGSINANEASQVCNLLSTLEKLPVAYSENGFFSISLERYGYRLPTEAEWEFACRGGTTTRYWSGDTKQDLLRAGWASPNSSLQKHPVGQLPKNPFGIFDVHGNVAEFVQDEWTIQGFQAISGRTACNPCFQITTLPTRSRMLHGGGSNMGEFECTAGYRKHTTGTERSSNFGIRMLLPVLAVKRNLEPELAKLGTLPEWKPLVRGLTFQNKEYSGLKFSGPDTRVVVPKFSFKTNEPYTFEFWAVPAGENNGGVFRYRAGIDGCGVLWNAETKGWRFVTYQPDDPTKNSVGSSVNSMFPLPMNRQHIACTYDPEHSTLRLFVNGVPAIEKISSVNLRGIESSKDDLEILTIGAHHRDTLNQFFDGVLQGLRISHGIRYDGEFLPEEVFESDSNTFAVYRFDEGEGNILHDSSGNAHHGEIIGAKWVKISATTPTSN